MRNLFTVFMFVVGMLVFSGTVNTALANSYVVTNLGTLGGSESKAYAVNDSGQVVGEAQTASGNWHAFLWEDINNNRQSDPGEMIDLSTLGGGVSVAYGINNSGQVVGHSDSQPFLWEDINNNRQSDPGEMIDLGALGGDVGFAWGINISGQVVGYATTFLNLREHAFLWEDINNNRQSDSGEMIDLGTLTGVSSIAFGINDSGQVVGQSGDFAFLWEDINSNRQSDPGEMIFLGTLPDYTFSHANAINNSGQVVGYAFGGPIFDRKHAFHWKDFNNNRQSDPGEMIDLMVNRRGISEAWGVNNLGQVVGTARFLDQPIQAVLSNKTEGLKDLNNLIPAESSWNSLRFARAINDTGIIVGYGMNTPHAFILTNPNPNIPSIIPQKGGDTGNATVVISGGPFIEGATAKLTRDGESDIVGDPTTVGENGRTISTTFDLSGKAQGEWDVVVENPDGTSFILSEGFTIEEGRAAQVWVDIIGRDVIRVGREQTFNVMYGNRGNVDAVGVPLWIAGIPSDATLRLGFETTSLRLPDGTLADGIDEVPVALDVDREIVIALLISVIPTGSTGVLNVSITVPTPSDFELRAWQNPPFFRSPLLSLPVAECISALAKQIIGILPGGGCLSALGEELSLQLARIFITNDPETVKIGDVYYNVATGCIGGFIKAEALKHVSDMIGAIASGVATGVECGEAFPVTPDVVQQVQTVTSFDPNEKIGSKGIGEKQYLSIEEPLRYVIFFENVETATAPAQEVVITDQLDMVNMDLETLNLGPIIFGNTIITPPPGLSQYTTDVDLRPDNNLIVSIRVSLNTDTGVLTWQFTSIDPATGELPEDPLAGFLPPNVNPPEGDGTILFTVRPKEGLLAGTEIRNMASIVFDTNAPIETPEWFNTLDNTTPISQVLPLPIEQNSTEFLVEWSGTDAGSGIKNYTIYVSEDSNPFTEWLKNTTDTSGTFSGEDGKTYEFYSVARDQTDNLEDKNAVAEAMTFINIDQDNDGIPDDGDACSNSDLSPTVIIDSCDTQVNNLLDTKGCTITDQIVECAAGATNHDDFVSCVANLTNNLMNAGIITRQEKGKIQSCAAQANIP